MMSYEINIRFFSRQRAGRVLEVNSALWGASATAGGKVSRTEKVLGRDKERKVTDLTSTCDGT
jgi:hypothetical protein